MTTELLIAGKSAGKIWECSNSVKSVVWKTERTGAPGSLQFTIVKSGGLSFEEGDTVRFSVDGRLQFYGWVFTKSKNRWGEIDVTCYDRLRYLKANAAYNFKNQKAGDIIRQIAEDFRLEVSFVADTGYAIPSFYRSDVGCLDIIGEAVQQTLLNTGDIYVFFDDGDGLALKRPQDMISDAVIGERSLLLDYTYKTDIDSQTYNSVKLVWPNEQTGTSDGVEIQDPATIERWGLLRLYQQLDGDVNAARAESQARAMLGTYNRRLRTLSVSALGVPGLRAGMMVRMLVPGLGDINLDQYVLLESVTHTWENSVHTMDFDTMAI